MDEGTYLTELQTAGWLIFTRTCINLSLDIFFISLLFTMLYKHCQTFCPEGQLISKLAETLADLRISRAKTVVRIYLWGSVQPGD